MQTLDFVSGLSVSNSPNPSRVQIRLCKHRLDYQPLFGKMSPHSSPRTRETAEIEPNANTENVFYCLTMGSWQILKGVLEGLPRSPSLCVFLVAQSGTVMIVQRESRQRAHRHGGDFIFAGKSALKCVLANVLADLTVSFVPVAKQWRVNQIVNRVTSQIIQQIVR